MSELAQTVTPQGLLAVCGFVDVPLDQLDSSKLRLAAVLANVRDPGNAGTVLRTADAAGADAVVFARRLGRPVQRQVRAGQRGQPVSPARGGRGRGSPTRSAR